MARYESDQCDYTFDAQVRNPPRHMTVSCPECDESHFLWRDDIPEDQRNFDHVDGTVTPSTTRGDEA